MQNYNGPSGGSNQYPGGSNQGPADRRSNQQQPRLPSLPDPRDDARYQDAGDIFRQFADQQDGLTGGDPNSNSNNNNVPSSGNSRNSNSANNNNNNNSNNLR